LYYKEAKSLPDFKGTDDYLVCITLNGLVLDKRMLLLLGRIGNERLESLSTEDFLVINTLFYEQKLPSKLRSRTKRLIDMGIIENAGRSKYVLARSIYVATGKPGVYTRLVGLDRETNKELILKHIRKNGKQGSPLNELQQVLPGHSRRQIQFLLDDLKNEMRIKVAGKTKGAKWFLV